jgi:hypothetical protein
MPSKGEDQMARAKTPKTIRPGARAQLSARAQGRRMGRKPVPENETRAERFKRIGTKRMNNVIRQIQLLGNLCSPNYECDGNDLALMRTTIIRELDMAMARFTPRKRETGASAFTFDPRTNADTSH